MIQQPAEGEPWEKLEVEGMYVIDYETNEKSRVETPPMDEMFGYVLHTAEFTVPGGQEIIELRLEQPARDVGSFRIDTTDFAFQAYPSKF